MSTYIEDITEKQPINYIPSENIEDDIYDFELPYDIRINCIKQFYEKKGVDETIDIIYHIYYLYSVSDSTSNKELLTRIGRENPLDEMLNFKASDCLCSHALSDENVETLLICMKNQRCGKSSVMYRFSLLEKLLKNETHHDDIIEEFSYLIDTYMRSSNFHVIYMYIRKLECEELMNIVSESNNISLSEKMLALQFLSSKEKDNINNSTEDENIKIDKERDDIQEVVNKSIISKSDKIRSTDVLERILDIALNDKNEYNVRADASDTLISSENEFYKNEGLKILDILANVDNAKTKTFYTNAQNVHNRSTIEKSMNTLSFLIKKVDMQNLISIERTKAVILSKVISDDIKTVKTQKSLERIEGDNIKYGENKLHLSTVLRIVYTFIYSHKHKIDLENRLVEEIIDMAYTCSSGFFTRLLNSICGYTDEFIAGMDWADQISANLTARLNKILQTEYDGTEEQSRILEQMTITDDDLTLKRDYLDFMRKHLGVVSASLKEEFVITGKHVNDTDFEYHLRDAISWYEGF